MSVRATRLVSGENTKTIVIGVIVNFFRWWPSLIKSMSDGPLKVHNGCSSSITNYVFSHTKLTNQQLKYLYNSQFYNFRHILLFLQDLLIHSFFPSLMFDPRLAKGLSLSLVHKSMQWRSEGRAAAPGAAGGQGAPKGH